MLLVDGSENACVDATRAFFFFAAFAARSAGPIHRSQMRAARIFSA
jgi:hypothetical protein